MDFNKHKPFLFNQTGPFQKDTVEKALGRIDSKADK
jgi:hypothetical protein